MTASKEPLDNLTFELPITLPNDFAFILQDPILKEHLTITAQMNITHFLNFYLEQITTDEIDIETQEQITQEPDELITHIHNQNKQTILDKIESGDTSVNKG